MTVMSQQADTITDTEFADLTEPFRRELLAHCYRMLGSVDDAEDVVQESYLRAWRSYSGFEGRSSVRTWLYQIATNTCLTARQHRTRRALPSGLGGPGQDHEPGSEFGWLQPMPDALVTGEANDPAVIAVTRDSLRLALIASFQYLPPRQRAILLLREVLAFPAEDVARMLGTTTVAVKSALQRARTRLSDVAPAGRQLARRVADGAYRGQRAAGRGGLPALSRRHLPGVRDRGAHRRHHGHRPYRGVRGPGAVRPVRAPADLQLTLFTDDPA
jgi:RNA polymerase sigma-70 factor (ECF subfamily)